MTNRITLAAFNGSITAQRTLDLYKPVQHTSLSTKVKGVGNRPPSNKEYKGDSRGF